MSLVFVLYALLRLAVLLFPSLLSLFSLSTHFEETFYVLLTNYNPFLTSYFPTLPLVLLSALYSCFCSSGSDNEAVTSPTSDRAAVAKKRFTLQGFSNLKAQKGNCRSFSYHVIKHHLIVVVFLFSVGQGVSTSVLLLILIICLFFVYRNQKKTILPKICIKKRDFFICYFLSIQTK